MAFENGGRVHHVDATHFSQRNHFQLAQHRFGLRRGLGLDCAHHHILAAFLAPPPFVQHAKGFADARGVSQEHLQPAPALVVLFGLQLLQQFFRSAASNRARHGLLPLLRLPCIRAKRLYWRARDGRGTLPVLVNAWGGHRPCCLGDFGLVHVNMQHPRSSNRVALVQQKHQAHSTSRSVPTPMRLPRFTEPCSCAGTGSGQYSGWPEIRIAFPPRHSIR